MGNFSVVRNETVFPKTLIFILVKLTMQSTLGSLPTTPDIIQSTDFRKSAVVSLRDTQPGLE